MMRMAGRTKKCCFRDCDSSSKSHKSLRFFGFRKHDYKIWVMACGNEKLKDFSEYTLTKYHHYVCEKHFETHDYVQMIYPFIKSSPLRQTAIPREHINGKFLIIKHC